MCGICGLVCGDAAQTADADRVRSMNDALTHRGPDDGGLWSTGPAALAMRRLRIIDLEGGRQPMTLPDGSVTVVFNGEIYNYRELRRELQSRGHVFQTESDTEVLLHGYQAYGDTILDRLNGMFAFGVYDANRKRLLLARDRLGIKPLFYTVVNGQLAFASEIDSLIRSGLVDGRINTRAIHAYFTRLYVPGPDTAFLDVLKLGAGEALVFENGRAQKRRYWTLSMQPDSHWTEADAKARLNELLEDSVRLQQVADVPVGAFLSGGVDSTAVVALMRRVGVNPIRTFTIGFDDKHADELAFARLAARHYETDHHEAILKPDIAPVAEGIARHFGEPFADSSAIPMWLVSKTARQHVTVALSGDGGDELFAGYAWLHNTLKAMRYGRTPAAFRGLVSAALGFAPRSPLITKARRFNADSFLEPRAIFERRQTCMDATTRNQLFRPDFLHAVDSDFDGQDAMPPEEWMQLRDTTRYLPDDILTKVDRMSMAHGLEARVPLLDHRLVEFAATLPFHFKYRGGVSKWILKETMRPDFPPRLLKQRKQGFAIPIHRWFREELRPVFADTVLSTNARCGAVLRPETVDRLYREHQSGRENHGHALWSILMFELWLGYFATVPGIGPGF
ncbi:MAG: asparagine synthetase B [Candidatus Hydrogenedentota bacterium]